MSIHACTPGSSVIVEAAVDFCLLGLCLSLVLMSGTCVWSSILGCSPCIPSPCNTYHIEGHLCQLKSH